MFEDRLLPIAGMQHPNDGSGCADYDFRSGTVLVGWVNRFDRQDQAAGDPVDLPEINESVGVFRPIAQERPQTPD